MSKASKSNGSDNQTSMLVATYGIENLKKLVAFPIDLARQVAESSKDGWQMTDIFGFVDEFTQLPDIVKNWPAVQNEIKDVDNAEMQELHAFVAQRFDLVNDKVEAFIENALMNAVSFIALIRQWKELKA